MTAITNQSIYNRALSIIKNLYGEHAAFRDGQYEAIEATLINNRTLVVQRTGWGKSLVYFTCTSILRSRGRGVTMVISPLLVLMENQIDAAKKLGLKCDVLNSTVGDRRKDIIDMLINDRIDLLLVTPETLFKEDLQDAIRNMKIGLFVIDEAHCISDWGHDFRLEYGNLYKVLGRIPTNVPVLATTATANNRVIEDLKRQLGHDVYVSRGPLTRDSLAIQVVKLRNKSERYAWILQNIGKIPGSGIIYCLTQRDCDYLSDFLIKNGISAMSYYSRIDSNDEKNKTAEKLFMDNKIKVIVATIKLGMGYDKGDIGFVIHFQQPSNIVSYYQQIGRAGRNIRRAYAFLMSGKEDNDILNYFINTAFPSERDTMEVISLLEKNNGLSVNQVCAGVNVRRGEIEKALIFLANEGYLSKDAGKYYLTPKKFVYNSAHYSEITARRIQEKEQMAELIHTDQCYSKFIVNCLDDDTAGECGICSNCRKRELIASSVDMSYLEKALGYINSLKIDIEPRKMWAATSLTKQSKISFVNETGICLSKYGDVGYGELVQRDKYSKSGMFCDELVGTSAGIIKPVIKEQGIRHMTCVPSLRSPMVEDFTKRLAERCGVSYVPTLSKHPAQQQKLMQNSSYQCENALKSYYIEENTEIPAKLILIDDIVDSRWTLTVCGYKLMEKGCKKVIPFALADSKETD
ncbi:MAG: RecQ family ATP-dependent DNA helicase [Eubacteriales bacterium]